MVLRWRTDLASDSRVRFGSVADELPFLVDDPTLTTEHEVQLAGLTPATRYFYSIGSTTETLAGADGEHFFFTSPTPGSTDPVHVWVLGDSGAGDAFAAAVRDAFEASGDPADLWLMLGDNAYQSGTDVEYQNAVFNMYPRQLRTSVLWPTLGNHDGLSADSATLTGPYYDIFTLPTAGEAGGVASGTEAYYSFDHGNLHFICLDSFDTPRSPEGPMMTWLEADLAATTATWVIAYWHHAPYSKGSHDSDIEVQLVEMREAALPILEDFSVDLVLAGHSHAYERSFLLDGHYDTSDTFQASMILNDGDGRPDGDGAYTKTTAGTAFHEGTVYVVAGTSSRLGGGALDHPAMALSQAVRGSLILDVEGYELQVRFLDDQGVVMDSFAIHKAGGNQIFADGFEDGNTLAWSSETM